MSGAALRVLMFPTEVVPDLSTRGNLLRYSRLRDHGFTIEQAAALTDAGYDVIDLADLPVVTR